MDAFLRPSCYLHLAFMVCLLAACMAEAPQPARKTVWSADGDKGGIVTPGESRGQYVDPNAGSNQEGPSAEGRDKAAGTGWDGVALLGTAKLAVVPVE